MNWKLFGAMAALIGVGASVALGQGTSTTIVEASYISNVFGQSNFVKNPNAKLNTSNVTVSSATVLRSISSPLVATSEFTITTSTATGFADWATRTFDQGMKGQNCEARFTYKGFTVGSTTAQIRQGSNTVAQLTLTPSATDPRIASINFPCGDLSAATTFRLQQATAALTGTNEIGGIYVGLATNQANVAQAELVGGLTTSSLNSVASGSLISFTNLTYQTGSVAAFGKATSASNTLSVTFDSLPAGEYMVVMNQPLFMFGGTGGHSCRFRIYEDTSTNSQLIAEAGSLGAAAGQYVAIQANMPARFSFTTTASRTFRVQVNNNGWTASANGTCYTESSFNGGIFVYRFPTSSELVVTPERQNVWGAVKFTAGNSSLFSGSVPGSTYLTYTDATNWKPTSAGGAGTYYGKATATTTTGELGLKIPNMPIGTYRMTVRGDIKPDASAGASGQYTGCTILLYETTTTTGFAQNYQFQGHGGAATVPSPGDLSAQFLMDGIYSNSSVADRNFIVRTQKLYDSTAGNVGRCAAITFQGDITITMQPLDQPSNSALYVQGPVQAAATGATIPSGYQMEGITTVNSTLTSVSNGANRTGTGLTLNPGVYFISIRTNTGATAPTKLDCGITKTVNGTAVNDDRNFSITSSVVEQSNTTQAKDCISSGYFKVTSSTTFYPVNYIYAPVSSSYQVEYWISAIRLN